MIIESFGTAPNEDLFLNRYNLAPQLQDTETVSQPRFTDTGKWVFECNLDALQLDKSLIKGTLFIQKNIFYNNNLDVNTQDVTYFVRFMIQESAESPMEYFEMGSKSQGLIRVCFKLLIENKDITEKNIKNEYPEYFL